MSSPLILDGKIASIALLDQLQQQVTQAVASGKRAPHLVAVIVGNNGASETYVASKAAHSEKIGIQSTIRRLPAEVSEADLLAVVAELNHDPEVDGFIVQLPLPAHISEAAVTNAIDWRKDVDGFHPENVGRLAKNLPSYVSATPLGIVKMLEHYQVETAGKHCVIVGRSNIVGMPMALLMQRNAYPGNCTVTVCHSRTPDLAYHTRQADILIAALGKPRFVTAEMVKPGAVVIDVGITRVPDASKKSGYAVVGDVDFAAVAPISSAITPVPGGVGLMTIAALIQNTVNGWVAFGGGQ
jgi:methylenetetrahydrofolate dehydrogenase (NADP+) / methenyltetrahydrofolate cyclohydrolase